MNRIMELVSDGPCPRRRPPSIKASGSSGAVTRVAADTIIPGHVGQRSIEVVLERDHESGETFLEINAGSIYVGGEIMLHNPDALRGLVEALLELMNNPHGAQILATIH
jgi:hypothetical protein